MGRLDVAASSSQASTRSPVCRRTRKLEAGASRPTNLGRRALHARRGVACVLDARVEARPSSSTRAEEPDALPRRAPRRQMRFLDAPGRDPTR